MAITVESFFGGFVIALCLSFILYGMTTLQALAYLSEFPEDPRHVRWTVITVWAAETVHTGICIEIIYRYLVTEYGNTPYLDNIQWTFGAAFVVTIIIVTLVHSVFIHRIWILSHHCVIAVMIPCILIVVNIGIDAVICHSLFNDGTWIAMRADTPSSVALNASVSLTVAIDMIVAATLLYYLHKGRRGFERSDRLITRLQVYAVKSGALTIACSLSVMLAYLLLQDSLLYTGFDQMLCKLYNNLLLASLNARDAKKDSRHGNVSGGSESYELSYQKSALGRRTQASRAVLAQPRVAGEDNSAHTSTKGGTIRLSPDSLSTIDITQARISDDNLAEKTHIGAELFP